MSENDTIPRVENLKNEMAGWLYFCPWYGWHLTGEQNNPVEWLVEMYNSEYCITLDELPDLKTYPITGYTSSPSTTKPTPTPTNKPTGSGYDVSGYVSPDFSSISGSSVKADFVVQIGELKAKTDSDGYFKISNVPASTNHTIKISKPGYLTFEKNIAILSNEQISASNVPIILWAGDLNNDGAGDGAINMSDIVQLAKSFGSVSGDDKFISSCDLNIDFSINMSDVIIIAKHFNFTSANYPEIN
jgi:mannan endo-1,4-beta-mannosidase